MSRSDIIADDLIAQFRSRCPLIWVVTKEESRVEKYIIKAAAASGRMPHLWDVVAGVQGIDKRPDSEFRDLESPDALLSVIDERAGGTKDNPKRDVWIMRDLPAWITAPAGVLTLRHLRNTVRELPSKEPYDAQAIVVVTPSAEGIPPELAQEVIEWPLPDRDEIAEILDAAIATLPEELQEEAVNGSRDAVIDAAVGLSDLEAQATFAKSIIKLRKVDPTVVAQEKKSLIAQSVGLEWLDPIPGGLDAVGGLDGLKAWLGPRANAFTPEARAYGLPMPKGVFLNGVSGCGKTLSAKAIAAAWKRPLLKLDLNAQKAKFVGESEANLRSTFQRIEAMGQCVVLVDEIEKVLSGATSGSADGGVSADTLSFLLGWMQDNNTGAFIVATANNAESLPPELLRKGRFDEVFWVDVPNSTERKAVLAAALREYGRNAKDLGIDLTAVSEATDTFTGAEIAALVPESMFVAFNDGMREINTDDLLTAAKSVVPLARTAGEKITRLREYWSGRAKPATAATAPRKATRKADTRVLDI